MVVLKYLLAFLVISLVVFIHELGHYIVAKASGVVVEEFSMGMGPRLLKFTKNGTMYSIKLFFFGGSCRMKGFDLDDEDSNPEGSFYSASLAKRFAILFAGPAFNFLLAFVFSVVLLGNIGYDPCVVYSVNENSVAAEAGLEAGDQIVKINGSNIVFYGDYSIFMYDYAGQDLNISFVRDGKTYQAKISPEHINDKKPMLGVSMSSEEPLVNAVSEGYPAAEAGIKEGDLIVSIDGIAIQSSADVSTVLKSQVSTEDDEVVVVIKRGDEEISTKIVPQWIQQDYYEKGFTVDPYYRVKTSPLETVGHAFQEVGYWIKSVFVSFKFLFRGTVSVNEVTGPVGLVSTIGNVVQEASQDGAYYVFLNLLNWCILISANLGVMNLLPIPALDGGRILFLLIELVIRKPIPKKYEGIINFVSFALLMVLMVLIFFNDIRKIIMGG